MYVDEKKKVLFVTGLDYKFEHLIKAKTKSNPENIYIVQSSGPVTAFNDVMRDIILTVYQENVEEIYVSKSLDDRKDRVDILNKISENKELLEKIQLFDYLFDHCKSEFPGGNFSEWLAGKPSADTENKSISVIRDHPLLPSNVKVAELLMEDRDDHTQSEASAS